MPRFRQHVCYSLTPSSSTVFAERRGVQWNFSWNLFKILRPSCHNDRGMRSQTGAVFVLFLKRCERVWATLTLSERRLYTSSASLLFFCDLRFCDTCQAGPPWALGCVQLSVSSCRLSFAGRTLSHRPVASLEGLIATSVLPRNNRSARDPLYVCASERREAGPRTRSAKTHVRASFELYWD